MLTFHSIAADPSTNTEEKKRDLYDKAYGTKETVKRSVDERVPEDVRDETSSTEAKDKGFMGRIRGMKVFFRGFISLAGTYPFHVTEWTL